MVSDGNGGETPDILQRKRDHLRIVASGAGRPRHITTGLESIRFEHCALPELNLDEIDLGCSFLDKPLRAPLLISSMTGGPAEAEAINRHIAQAAEALGIGFGVGSQRIAISERRDDGLKALRAEAPLVPILANLGGAQIASEFGLTEAERAVEMIGADALIVHLNPLQEAVQAGGDRNWRGVLAGFERLAASLSVPVIAKEVGFGISVPVARRLRDAGAYAIDVAGAGGTNWAAVEASRAPDARTQAIAGAFSDWGIPTAEALTALRAALPDTLLIGSGGIRNGLDVARAIRIGADLAGTAAGVLDAARNSTEALIEHLQAVIEQTRIVCFVTGSRDLPALRGAVLL